ncbi:auxin-induced protein X10A-like [Neltuma alba]|uniref:auxin-induced protein X10A-like n=1 Tax=Neltuma alba TaxID=207710 RepID=UPI0010A2CA36|nr:auxin-induced protein X10A-like [Prosopis alba]
MGFRLPVIRRTSFAAKVASSKSGEVPKGYLAVYVGEEMKRFVIPVSYLNQPLFQELLSLAEEEFGYDHPMGALTIPCREDVFLNVTSSFNGSSKSGQVPKGYLAVYVGEDLKRFVIPISYLNQPSFQELLGEAEEEFRFDHPRVLSPFLVQKMSSCMSLLPSMAASL